MPFNREQFESELIKILRRRESPDGTLRSLFRQMGDSPANFRPSAINSAPALLSGADNVAYIGRSVHRPGSPRVIRRH
jgi:hypothetical protein